jgi:ABC-type phosphate/phosphonate transport system permease subunit
MVTNSDPAAPFEDRGFPATKFLFTLLAIGVALVFCWHWAEVRLAALFEPGALASVGAFISGLYPPDISNEFLRVVLAATLQTVAIAVAGAALSVGIGLPLGILATTTLWRHGVLLSGERRGAATFFSVGSIISRAPCSVF